MEFYIKKSNGRYQKYAEQWEGFPADGWWFVGDGRKNLVVPIDAPRPLEKLRYQQHRNEIVRRLVGGNTSLSLHDFVEKTLNILEELIDEESKKTSIAIDQDHYDLLSRIANYEGLSKSALVSVCIAYWISQHDTWIEDNGYYD